MKYHQTIKPYRNKVMELDRIINRKLSPYPHHSVDGMIIMRLSRKLFSMEYKDFNNMLEYEL